MTCQIFCVYFKQNSHLFSRDLHPLQCQQDPKDPLDPLWQELDLLADLKWPQEDPQDQWVHPEGVLKVHQDHI